MLHFSFDPKHLSLEAKCGKREPKCPCNKNSYGCLKIIAFQGYLIWLLICIKFGSDSYFLDIANIWYLRSMDIAIDKQNEVW